MCSDLDNFNKLTLLVLSSIFLLYLLAVDRLTRAEGIPILAAGDPCDHAVHENEGEQEQAPRFPPQAAGVPVTRVQDLLSR